LRDNQLYSFVEAGILISRNMGIASIPACTPTRCVNESGIQYDEYEPKLSINRTIILVYGMTIAGEKEGRITRFARALAGSGFRVVIPSLPGLKSFRFDAVDLQIIEKLISEEKDKENHWMGIIAFSVGAGMVLTVASYPTVSQNIDLLILFSPYYSLQKIEDRFQAQLLKKPSNEKDWDNFIWWHLVLMYRQQDSINLSNEEKSQMIYLLDHYCSDVSIKEKTSFYKTVINHKRIGINGEFSNNKLLFDQFSSQGKLNSVSSRVMIFHDPNDPWAPVHESEQIIAELRLRQACNPDYQKLLVSPIMSHVSPQFTWRFMDFYSAVDIMGELFR
jgi:hypothetical protein